MHLKRHIYKIGKKTVLTFFECLNENARLPACVSPVTLLADPARSPPTAQYTSARSGLGLGPPSRLRLQAVYKVKYSRNRKYVTTHINV